MRALLATALVAAANAYGEPTAEDFMFISYMAKHGKTYSTVQEFNARKANFFKSDAKLLAFKSVT